VSPAQAAAASLEAAVARVRAGGLVAYPTETVWGLGADARSPRAMARLRAWKGRAEQQPVAVLVRDLADLAQLGIEAGELARGLAGAFWPGPLTLVLPSRARLAAGVARRDGAVGVRCSPHPSAAGLARRLHAAGIGPLTATSLNRHGEPPARTRRQALARCRARSAPGPPGRARAAAGAGSGEPLVLGAPAPDAWGAPPSSVVDLSGAKPVVLRYGALGPKEIDPWLEGEGRR
jgi:tRNA threonylcarbamoyl adenosine modification protein (Sua5/YciO/YrdC/YwlC family)